MGRPTKLENPNPPYITLNKIQQLFQLLSTRNFSHLSANDLVTRGFSKSDASQSLQGLRFLSFIDKDGNTTELMKALSMRGDGRAAKLESIIKAAYKKLYETVPDPETLSKDELHDELMAVYGLSSRLANTAAPVFLWLCSEAGIKITEDLITRKHPIVRDRNDTITKSVEEKTSKNVEQSANKAQENYRGSVDNGYIDLNIGNTGIRILIPKRDDLEDAIAVGALLDIRKEVINFANKFGLKKSDNSE